MSDINEMLIDSEAIESSSSNRRNFTDPEQAVLTNQNGAPVTMRVRIVGPYHTYWEAWVNQQAVDGVEDSQVGRRRKIISYGYDNDGNPLDAFAAKLNEMAASPDEAQQAMAKEWKLKKFFAFNVVPMEIDGRIDQWCTDARHTKLLTTNKYALGIGPGLFKQIAQVFKMQLALDPNIRLGDIDILLSREGQRLETRYGAMPCTNSVDTDFTTFDTYDFAEVIKVSSIDRIENITGLDLSNVSFTQPRVSEPAPSQQSAQPAAAAPAARPNAAPAAAAATQPAAAPAAQPAQAAPAQAAPAQAQPVLDEADCPHCGARVSYPNELAGSTVTCPHCQNDFETVPF